MPVDPPAPRLDRWIGVPLEHHLLPRSWGTQHVVTTAPAGATAATPTLVLLHGWPQHWWAWRHVIRDLGRDVRVVALDTRGFGWSAVAPSALTPATVTSASLAADVNATVAELGIARAHLVGHDWGGWFAFHAALAEPARWASVTGLAIMPPWLDRAEVRRHARGLLYIGPMAVLGDRVAARPGLVRRLLTFSSGAAGRLWWTGPEGRAAVRAYTDPLRTGPGPRATRLLYRRMATVELWAATGARPPRLAMPGRVVLGTAEQISKEAMYAGRSLPEEVETLRVPGAGHWLLDEAPEAVTEVVRGVLGST